MESSQHLAIHIYFQNSSYKIDYCQFHHLTLHYVFAAILHSRHSPRFGMIGIRSHLHPDQFARLTSACSYEAHSYVRSDSTQLLLPRRRYRCQISGHH